MSGSLFTCSLHYTVHHNIETLLIALFKFYPTIQKFKSWINNIIKSQCYGERSIVKGTCEQETRHSGLAISEIKA